MSYSVSLHSLARAELNESTDYYNEVSADIASRFLDDFEATVQSITANPTCFLKVTNTVHRKAFAMFPFFLFYSVRAGEIRILAIAHQSRRPFYWAGRS